MKRWPTLLIAAAILVSIVACSDSFTPSEANVAGNYRLRTFTTIDAGGTTDWAAAGASLGINLNTDGTTAGQLVIPGSVTGGAGLIEDMAGTWALSGDIVTFSQTADTFVRNMSFIASKGRLSGDRTIIAGTQTLRLTVVLVK